jgi:chromosome segregation ATPase
VSATNWPHVIEQGMSVVTTGGLAGLLLNEWFRSRRVKRSMRLGEEKRLADAADVITDTALTLVQPLRNELADVRKDLASAREMVNGLEQQLRRASNEAQRAWAEVRRLRMAIVDPTATLEHLRQQVSNNGRPGGGH